MKTFAAAALAASTLFAIPATAATFVVAAQGNSSSGSTGLATLSFNAGDAFTVTADASDLWSAGSLPRYSNAGGLTANLFATGADESGQAAGTQIGQSFGTWSQNGFSAPHGALVGQIGTDYYLLGTSFTGVAASAGVLNLFYWDNNNGDNTGDISVTVNGLAAVPEAATWTLLVAGFGISGAAIRRRRRAGIAQLV